MIWVHYFCFISLSHPSSQACSKFFPGNNSIFHFPDMNLKSSESQTWTLQSCYPPRQSERSDRKISESHTSENHLLIFINKNPALLFLHLSVTERCYKLYPSQIIHEVSKKTKKKTENESISETPTLECTSNVQTAFNVSFVWYMCWFFSVLS